MTCLVSYMSTKGKQEEKLKKKDLKSMQKVRKKGESLLLMNKLLSRSVFSACSVEINRRGRGKSFNEL